MRFMVMVRANGDTESGQLPSAELLEAMGRYNEELVKAGVLLAGEGLKPSAEGARVRFSGAKRTVVDGKAAARELIAGFWILLAPSLEACIEWVKRCPNPTASDAEIEIRPIYEADDFGDRLSPAVREQEARLREQVARH